MGLVEFGALVRQFLVDRRPEYRSAISAISRPKPSFAFGGVSPLIICSISNSDCTSTLGFVESPSDGSVRLSSADTPSDSPALRTIGCTVMEPLYCTQSNHGVFQIRG